MNRWTSLICVASVFLFGCASQLSPTTPTLTSPNAPCSTSAPGDEWMVMGSPEQLTCLAHEIPAFGGYDLRGCNVLVYLVDPSQEAHARSVVEPVVADSLWAHYECHDRFELQFGRSLYSYSEVQAWKRLAMTSLSGQTTGWSILPLEHNRFRVLLQKSEDVEHIRPLLLDRRIPADVFEVASRQPLTPSTILAPPSSEPSLVFLTMFGGVRLGPIKLGAARSADVSSLLSSTGGLGPVRENAITFHIGSASMRPPALYTPPRTMNQLYFQNDRLVLLVEMSTYEQPASRSEFIFRYPAARETRREADWYELQTPLDTCVTLMAVFGTANDQLASDGYAFLCPLP